MGRRRGGEKGENTMLVCVCTHGKREGGCPSSAFIYCTLHNHRLFFTPPPPPSSLRELFLAGLDYAHTYTHNYLVY